MSLTVTLIEGDGIGPEVVAATREVLAATGVVIRWDVQLAGAAAVEAHGTPCPDELISSVQRNRIALKGPVGTPIGRGFRSVNVTLRKALDLYACLRPVKNIQGITTRFSGVDLVIVRENTEGLYSGLEHMVVPGVAESLKIVSERASTRIAEFAFRFARANARQSVTVVHKANIMKLSDGLFLDCCRRVGQRYPEISSQEVIVDACAMQLVRFPERFDVLVMDNLYGDILSDLCAGLVGGLGVVPGANLGDECALFEAVHGSAPDIAGKGVANPTALILSAALMLEYLGERAAAVRVREAVDHVFAKTTVRTGDLGGNSTTDEFTRAVVLAL
ncbi:MAG: isocitrate/isopropylmalate dehydrogenase family protein [Deltaproteobacteria bacterium]|nr:isocitrate/isopropylmalate dehydrogenase family protein [Deltaproteobacteria bacterium]